MAMFVCFLIVALAAAPALSYPTGAPAAACVDMVPQHGPPPQAGPSPYKLVPDKTTLQAGQKVQLTVSGADSEDTIRGFIIEARQPGSTEALGHFVVAADDDFAQLMDCGEGTGNAVTHKKHDPKDDRTSFTVTWVAPADLKDDIEFRATIVKDFHTFWAGIVSDKVKVY